MYYKRVSRNLLYASIRKFKKMKISILFMCLLAVAYATESAIHNHKLFCRDLEYCSKELRTCRDVPCTVLIDVHVWYCILKEAGVIKQNQIIREEGIKYCMSILDKKDWNICHTKVVDCLDNEYRKLGSNIKENDKAYCQITCIILKGVVDKIKQCNIKKNE
ncbi:PREDICTED: venom allergen 4-like [Atta colombica]|uniref:venom allergen 4-like n=1 Tax=Atta colombica TaxID=520822 RepID=UPI00084C6002|nr:PREDICTED: venom allergen 4-like [Atta colombica]